MSKSNRFFLSALAVFLIGNILQIVIVVPFMAAFGNSVITESVRGGMGLFLAYQANTLPLIAVWITTGVVFFLGVRAEMKEDSL